MSLGSPSTFAPGAEIAGHLVLATVPGERQHVRLRARDGQGRGAEVAIAIETGADETSLGFARQHAQRLAGVGNAGFCVPRDVCLTDRGLVTIRPWFDTLLSDGARDAGLPARSCLELVSDLARTLDRAHRRGLSHGSVIASNVALGPDGRGRLLDARPAVAPTADDTVALGAVALGWLGDYDGSPLIDLAVEQCAAAAAGRVAAADLGESLAQLLKEADATQDNGPAGTTPTAARRLGWSGIAAASFAVAAAVAAVVWAGSVDRSADRSPVVSAPLAPCDGTGPPGVTPGAEVALADLYGEGCGVVVTWRPSRAEAEVLVGPSLGRFRLGERGDELLLGDWDGDGEAEPALYRPITGEIFSWDAWPVDGMPVPSASQHDSGVVGGAPLLVDRGSRQAIEVVDGTPS